MDEQTRLKREINVLYEITRAINASLSQQEVLDVLLERLIQDLGYQAATLRLLDQERDHLELKAAYGLSQDYLAKGAVEVTKSAVDQKVLAGERVAVSDLRQETGFQYGQAAAREGLASMLAVPLSIQDQVIGVLHLYRSTPYDFSPEEQGIISAVANLGAQAIRRTRLFEAFRAVTQNINSSLKLEDVLARLLIALVGELNIKAGSIRLLGPNRATLHLAAAYGLSEEYLQKGSVKVAESPIDQRVLAESQAIVIPNIEESAALQYPEQARQEGIRSVFVLPLKVKDRLIGVMRLYSGQVRRYGAEEISFATAVADMSAIAIENAKLHEALKKQFEALKEDADGWYRFLAFG
jgi:two-component system, NtrC family, sensor kinase